MAGRKNKWDTHIAPRLNEIKKWVQDGYLEQDIIKMLGVSKTTFYYYKNSKTELSELIVNGRQTAVEELEKAALKIALGYEYEEEKMIIQLDEDGKPVRKVKEIYKKHQPANASVYTYLLNNWAKDKYSRDPTGNKLREAELELRKIKMSEEDW